MNMLTKGMDLKEGLRNYQFGDISDIVFEHIPFDENIRENIAKYLENKFKNISNKITSNSIILCVIVLLK